MGNGVSTSHLTSDQKGDVMRNMATALDEADQDAPPAMVVNQVKFAASTILNGFGVNVGGDSPTRKGTMSKARSASSGTMEELKSAAMSPKGGIKKLSSTIGTGNLEDDDMPDATTRLIRTLSLNYEEEESQITSAPSPLSRSNFRKRRLTYAKRGRRIAIQEMQEKNVFSAGEIGEDPNVQPPFPPSICGTYSCHGIEPAYDEVDRSDVVIAKINQDKGCVAYPYGLDRKQALFAALDGHGEMGEMVSGFAMHEIQARLENHPDFIPDVEKAFKEVFVEVDEALKEQKGIDAMYSGTTVVAVLMRGKQLYISNCGDSRAVMAKRNINGEVIAVNLSEDQNPNKPDEQARIEGAGGFVSPPPEPGLSARVWLDADFTQIGLAMARSIGDHAVSPVGVIAEPVVTEYTITDEDEFMIAASDGVWEFIESEEAVAIIQRYIPEGANKACEVLIETAAQRWREYEGDYRDDITAVVVKVQEIFKAVDEEDAKIEADIATMWDGGGPGQD
ncbi:hypothetical protein TrLO_g4194 [Triparma laevis f. longispina]|uniref:PPM-type phosphatase domain-containing protein n=1 Tax=Triparma laevis f. longispina TaxID=1714387 RepID=A0A9W7FK12_9STRA|nr:hypothetical protein TrLO_g4194 [Triparma laevis f. longispina]